MSIAVLTTSPERARAVATALRNQGFNAVAIASGPDTTASLVVDATTDLKALAVVTPLLADADTVVLVADNSAGVEPGFPSAVASPRGRWGRAAGRHDGSLADITPDLAYADWRDEILSLTDEPEGTYLGWLGRDGRPRVGVLRGATLSPLHPAGPTSDLTASWAASDENARVLARALVADALGALVRCPACREGRACPDCDGRGLNETGRQLADALAEDVVVRLPAAGFEVPAGQIEAWLRQRVAASATASPGQAPLAAGATRLDTAADAWSAPAAGAIPEVHRKDALISPSEQGEDDMRGDAQIPDEPRPEWVMPG